MLPSGRTGDWSLSIVVFGGHRLSMRGVHTVQCRLAIPSTVCRMSLTLDPVTAPQSSPAVSSPWFWKASHTHDWLPVSPTFSAVRPLVGACDGGGWPWTTVQRSAEAPCPFFQVLGAADRLLLEVCDGDEVWTVYQQGVPDPGRWVQLPGECAWWVAAIQQDEVFTAHEATQIGVLWLRGQFDSGSHGLREIHNPYSDARN